MCRVVLGEYLAARSPEKEAELNSLQGRLARASVSSGDSFAGLRALERAVALQDVQGVVNASEALLKSRRYDDVICAAIATSFVADDDVSAILATLEKDAYGDPRKRANFEALKCLQALHEHRIDDAVSWISRDRNWDLEAIGIGFGKVRQKVLTRAKTALAHGDPLSAETRRYIQAQRI